MLKNEISWKAPEFIYYEKGLAWRIAVIIVCLLILIYAIWTKDLLMGVTLLVLLIVGFFSAHKKPRILKISLNKRGLHVNDQVYNYSRLKTFWIHYQPPYLKTLNLETTDYLNRELTLQLTDMDPNKIREFLLEYLPEDIDREERVSERFLRILRF